MAVRGDLSELDGRGMSTVFELYCDVEWTWEPDTDADFRVTCDHGELAIDTGDIAFWADETLSLREQALYLCGVINSHYADELAG